MSKKYWIKLYEMFESEQELQEKYSDLYTVINKINESIKLQDESEKIQKELQELNKED